jgi:predicted nucleic acid-binding protein
MKIGQALAGIQTLSMDTSPFIYLVEKHPVYEARIVAIFGEVGAGHIQVITSMLTLTEVLTMPLIKKQSHYVNEYRAMLLNTQSILSIPVDSVVAERAAELRAKYGLKTPDALHIATALETGCHAFLTNDMKLKQVTEIQILILDELEVS